jgi:hypothetical protein
MAIIQAPPISVTTLPMNSCSFASFIAPSLFGPPGASTVHCG